ncbi:sushi, von Willebrand factor type A, EGF and pentraxin domain-containing protein 1-like [Oculina patagonica]
MFFGLIFRIKMRHVAWAFYFWIICMIVGYGSTCDPPTPPYGSTIIYPSNQGKHASGSVVLFGCKQGFYLVGKPIIRCTGNTWTQSQFSCVGFCPDLRHIPNGQVVHASPNVGQAAVTAVEFRCNKYFRLIGSSRLECINGRWNGMVPFCEKLWPCVRLRAPANGTLHGIDNTHGANASFSCLTGFDLFGSSTLTCSNGAWSARVPFCKAYCLKIRDPPNGRMFGTRFSHGRVVTFECKTGYQLVGDRALRCIHGRWNSTAPVCEAMFCSKPAIPSNSYIVYPGSNQVSFFHGTRVFLACRHGYYVNGSPIMMCNQTVWFKREFSCVAMFCSKPAIPSNSYIIYPRSSQVNYTHGTHVFLACRDGYYLKGSPIMVCNQTVWVKKEFSCIEMVCPKPLIPSNSYIIYPRSSQVNYTHGTHIFLACRDGYYLKGSPIMVCIRTVWFKGEFSCIASCPVFGPIKNGIITYVTLKGGGEVEIKCRANYTLVGSPKLSCINGRWNGSLPSCKGL